MNSDLNVRTVRSIESNVERTSSGRRFVRFAAAMQAEPPPTEQIPDEQTRAQLPPAPSAAADSTVRRSTGARHRSNPWIRWLGIGSWALLCAALFVSLLSWPDRELLKRDGGTTSDLIQSPATVDALRAADRNHPTPMLEELWPEDRHKVTSESRPDLDSSAPAKPAKLEKAIFFAGGVEARGSGGPPLPRLKPPTN
jgi:hypothetical protein